MICLKLLALLLLTATSLWILLAVTSSGAVDFAEHMAEEGEHYDPYGYHMPPQVEKPQVANFLDVVIIEAYLSPPVILGFSLDHLARDHPPPLFYSICQSLRAPPTLIPA